MPEAHRLRLFRWQLFVTLTFRCSPKNRGSSLPIVFVWLRNVADISAIHFKRLIWVLRFELGSRGGRGHYHLCLAGLPPASVGRDLCVLLETEWQSRCGGLAEVTLYNPARNGLDYILKLPKSGKPPSRWKSGSGTGDQHCGPMLSDSLLEAVRRSRM